MVAAVGGAYAADERKEAALGTAAEVRKALGIIGHSAEHGAPAEAHAAGPVLAKKAELIDPSGDEVVRILGALRVRDDFRPAQAEAGLKPLCQQLLRAFDVVYRYRHYPAFPRLRQQHAYQRARYAQRPGDLALVHVLFVVHPRDLRQPFYPLIRRYHISCAPKHKNRRPLSKTDAYMLTCFLTNVKFQARQAWLP